MTDPNHDSTLFHDKDFERIARDGDKFITDEAAAQLDQSRAFLKEIAKRGLATARELTTMLHMSGERLARSLIELDGRWNQFEALLENSHMERSDIFSLLHDTAPHGIGTALDANRKHMEAVNRFIDDGLLLSKGITGILHADKRTFPAQLKALVTEETSFRDFKKCFDAGITKFGPEHLGQGLFESGPYLPDKLRVIEANLSTILTANTEHKAWELALAIAGKDPKETDVILKSWTEASYQPPAGELDAVNATAHNTSERRGGRGRGKPDTLRHKYARNIYGNP